MLRHISIQGVDHPVDLSIRTITKLAKLYNTDITGLVERITTPKDIDESLDFIEELAVIVLNDGAERANTGVSYSVYDVRDFMTVDSKFSDAITQMLLETFEQSEVFQMPPMLAAPKKAKK